MGEKTKAAAMPNRGNPMDVACPHCSSPAGEPCLRMTTGHQMARFHLPRVRLAMTVRPDPLPETKGIAAA